MPPVNVSGPSVTADPTPAGPSEYIVLARRLEGAIRGGYVELPVLPSVAMEVRTLIDKEATSGAIAAAVELEPTIAATLIRYANAAAYYGLADVQDLPSAITRLGRPSVRDTVMSLSARSAFLGSTEHLGLCRVLWVHSVVTAISARRLAAHLTDVSADGAFLAGLLHDIGKILVLRGITALRRADPQGFRVKDCAIPELMHVLHCSVADVVCAEWNIPNVLATAITNHHQKTFDMPGDTLTALVQLANRMAYRLGASSQPDVTLVLSDEPAARALGLNEAVLAGTLVEVEDEFKKVKFVL
jgi:HD-like signal output (HDOD) protein